MKVAPIVLFVYNRPVHTRKTVEALLNNRLSAESDLIIFSDAPKKAGDELVSKVRRYITSIAGFNSIRIIERETNLGLARSIIEGVTLVVNQYGSIIVLEDDLVTSPHFLSYMNQGLEVYRHNDDVISLHGYNYPVVLRIDQDAFFLKGADCWGWATWKRGWDLFEPDGVKLLERLKNENLTYEFDFNNAYPYTKMLEDQIEGKNDSWAIRWYASAFLANTLTLYPSQTLVKNIGLDASGTHTGKDLNYQFGEFAHFKPFDFRNVELKENEVAKSTIAAFFKKSRKSNLLKNILSFLKP